MARIRPWMGNGEGPQEIIREIVKSVVKSPTAELRDVQLGANSFLVKPTDFGNFITLFRTLIPIGCASTKLGKSPALKAKPAIRFRAKTPPLSDGVNTYCLSRASGLTFRLSMGEFRFTLVEDDEVELFLLCHTISQTFPHSNIASFSHAEDALHHIVDTGSDILITDHGMGRMSGAELIRELRLRGINIPIIMVSGSPQAEEEAQLAGATEFLLKSDDMTRMQERVRSLLSKPAARW